VQTAAEWVTIQILQVVKRSRKYKAKTPEQVAKADIAGMVHRSGAVVRYMVMTGLPAGKTFEKFWSTDFCETVKNQFGYDKWNRQKYSNIVSKRLSWPFRSVEEFFRLRLQVRLDPATCPPGDLDFAEVRGGTTKKWCRDIMRMRLRDGFVCPAGYPDDFACHSCPVGLSGCRAACHLSDHERGRCDKCGREDQVFDPDADPEVCLACLARRY
jgi:hypothetical protein